MTLVYSGLQKLRANEKESSSPILSSLILLFDRVALKPWIRFMVPVSSSVVSRHSVWALVRLGLP